MRRERPEFDPDRVRELILEHDGNVTKVAKRMKADSEELRAFIRATPSLLRSLDEVVARGVDESLTVLFDSLDNEHFAVRLGAAKLFLKSRAAARRGFTTADVELKTPARPGGHLALTWLDPGSKEEPQTIEGQKLDD